LENYNIAISTLPPGHYGIAEARKRLKAEYADCRTLEKKLWKSLPKQVRSRRTLSQDEILSLAAVVCKYLKLRPVTAVHFRSRLAREMHALGAYEQRKLHFPYADNVPTTAVCHEIAHHVAAQEGMNSPAHGGDFLWCLSLVYEVLVFWADRRK